MGRRKQKKSNHRFSGDDWDKINSAALEENERMAVKVPYKIKHTKGNNAGYVTGDYGYGHTTVQAPRCKHEGKEVVYEFDGKQIYAASSNGLNEFSGDWNLIIDLAGIVRMDKDHFVKRRNDPKYDKLRSFTMKEGTVKSEVLSLDWPDMNPPPVTLGFWNHLWTLLPEKSVVCCFGGHGRTGTCLASLMISSGIDYYTAVRTVREEHCHKAIESLTQELYLHAIWQARLNMDLLLATNQGKAADVKDIQADLAYTKEHPPTNHSSYGESKSVELYKPKDKDPENGSKTKLFDFSAPKKNKAGIMEEGVDEEGHRWRTVGEIVWVEDCTAPNCNTVNCLEPKHMGWIMIEDGVGKEVDGFVWGD